MKLMHSIILSVLFICCGNYLGFADDDLIKIGDQVPEFSFETEPGQSLEFTSYRENKVVVMVFFATWCGPCNKELPELNKQILPIYNDNSNFELMIFGREHNWKELNKFKKDKDYTLNFYPDPKREIYSKFASKYIPRTYVIDKNGKVIFAHIGFDDKTITNIKTAIDKGLNQ